MKTIAWGSNSKLLIMHLREVKAHSFAYCIDNFSEKGEVEGLPVLRSDALTGEKPDSFVVVVFAVSNASLHLKTAVVIF